MASNLRSWSRPSSGRRAGFEVAVAAPVEVGELELDVLELGDGLEDFDAFGGDFGAGAVAADDGDFVGAGHGANILLSDLFFDTTDTSWTGLDLQDEQDGKNCRWLILFQNSILSIRLILLSRHRIRRVRCAVVVCLVVNGERTILTNE